MIVVHGLVTPDGRLAVWAETTEAPAFTPPSRSGASSPLSASPPAEPPAATAPRADRAADASAPAEPPAATPPNGRAADASAAPVARKAPAAALSGPRPGIAPAPLPHPFAVLPPIPGPIATADLLLPSTPTGPAPSPELADFLPAAHRRTSSRRPTAWTVPIVLLPPATDPEPLVAANPDARPGSSLGHLADLVTFATALVNRGRVLPAITPASPPAPVRGRVLPASTAGSASSAPATAPIRRTTAPVRGAAPADLSDLSDLSGVDGVDGAETGGPQARWRPVLWGSDAATFDSLAEAMPGVTAAAAAWPTREATRAALDATVDAVVRARLAGRPLLADTQVRHDTVVRAWLAALTTPDARLRTAPPPAPPDPSSGGGSATSPDPAASGGSAAAGGPDELAGPRQDQATTLRDGGNRGPDGDDTGGGEPDGVGPASGQAPGSAAAMAVAELDPPGPPGPLTTAGGAVGAALAVPPAPAGRVAPAGPVVPEGPEVARLRETLERWADSGRPAPVRTCFRLSYVDEPDDDGNDDRDNRTDGGGRDSSADGGERGAGGGEEEGGFWLVEFLLQPADEPGLLVPAEDVWHDAASPLFRWVDYPQEVLLGDLGRASRLWPDLDDALRVPRPAELRLDTAGAYRFLTYATLLHDAGFGVLLPAQWQRRQELGLTLTVRTRQPAAPVLRDTTANRAAIVAFRWGLAIGDEFLSKADLVALARAKVPLVRLRGRWVHLDPERLRAGLAFLRRGGTGEMTAGEAMRLTRLIPDGDLPLPVTGVDGTGWLADLLTGRAVERLELLDEPASLTARLRPYQRRGLSWLAFLDSLGVGALLADDMGLGKTVQVLALEAYLRERGPRPPTLIVCPLSVLGNWRREIERFTPGLTVRVHHGSARPAAGELGGADLVLTTYQVATRDVETLAAVAWDRVVLDEAQHVKNAAGVTARAVRRLPARHRVALTGTPVENRLTELWSIADFLNPGLLGEASLFRARYSVPVERWGDADAARRLRRVTRPFLLRRVKTDRAVISDLPEKLERRQWCTLTLEQATLYKAVVDELFVKLREGRAGPQRKGLVLSAMTKLKQVCNHPAHLMGDGTPLPGRSGKLTRLEEILAAALAAGDRALVFTQFARFGHLLAPHLSGRLGTGVEFLHGGTPQGNRDRMVERFQSGAGPGVLLVSLKAGGTGLNLTAASHVVHVDRWWNPAAEAQATDRAFRIGQRRDVQVHTFVCIGTIEERIEHVMAGKRELAGVAVGSGEGWLTGLSTDDLLDLVTLSPEAVEDA
ncbi:SNF2-related protein [Dactylosporangium sp. CA-092794]|uniref:SNF2-related protein n=1 Tax=Dactylosporangium sp. CA-092794 TaxID=3239929 RepID=UPI003D8E5424